MTVEIRVDGKYKQVADRDKIKVILPNGDEFYIQESIGGEISINAPDGIIAMFPRYANEVNIKAIKR